MDTRFDRGCLLGLLVVLLILAGAAALYWAPQPTPPPHVFCGYQANRWCIQ